MKKALCRMSSLMLALLMAATVFVGCGKEDKPAGSEPTASADTSSDATSDGSEDTGSTDSTDSTDSGSAATSGGNSTVSKPKPGQAQSSGALEGIVVDPNKIDFKGKTITISYWDESSIPKKGKNEIADKQLVRIDAAQKKYNFKLNYKVVAGDNYKTQFTATAAAGKKFADIITHPTTWSFPTWIKNGYFAPLDSFVDYTSAKYKQMDGLTKYVDGKHYALCTPDSGPRIVAYNPALLKKAGCDDPLTLAQEGKWNWDTFLEIAKKTTITENGKVTQYGVGPNMFTALLESNGIYQVKMGNNKLTFGLDTPQALRTLNFFRELHQVHKVAKVECPSDLWKEFRDGKIAMQWGYLWEVGINVVDRRSTLKYKIVPVPLGPDVKTRQILQDNVLYVSFAPEKLTAPYKTKDLVAVYLDAFGTGDKTNPATYVDPYKSFTISNKRIFKTDEERDFYWDTWQESEMHFAPSGGDAAGQPGNLIWTNIMSPLQTSTESPNVIVSKNKKKIQAGLDEIMKAGK